MLVETFGDREPLGAFVGHLGTQVPDVPAVFGLAFEDLVESGDHAVEVVPQVAGVVVGDLVADFAEGGALAAHQLDENADECGGDDSSGRDEGDLHGGVEGQDDSPMRASSAAMRASWAFTTDTRATDRRSYRRPSTSPSR